MTEPTPRPVWRGGVASGAALAAALVATRVAQDGFEATLSLPIVLLAASAIAIHVRRLEAQLLTRALWFSTALVAAIHLVMPLGIDRPVSLAILAASVTALVAAGFTGLRGGADAGAFRPVAFRAPLLLAVGMGLVDALALAFYGLAFFEIFGSVSLALILGPLLAVAAVGVYRLRTGAVFAMLLLNAIVLGAAVSGALWVPPPLRVALVFTSLVQMLLPLPMLRAILRRSAAEPGARARIADAAAMRIAVAESAAADDDEAELEATAAPAFAELRSAKR